MTKGETRAEHAAAVAVGGLIALAAGMGIGRFVYTPVLPFMEEALALSKADAGIIASMNFLGYLLGALAAASTRLPGGRRGWLLGALAVSALSTGAMGLPPSMAVFLVLRFVGGVASAFVLVFASALVLDRLAGSRRPGLSAVHFAGVGAGIALSAVLVIGLAASGFDWQAMWQASGLVSLVALAAVIVLVPGGPEAEPLPTARPGAAVDRRLTALIAAYGLFGFGYVITATFVSTMVRTTPELRSIEPVVWLVVGLAALPSVALWTWLGRHWGSDRGFAIACIVEAIGVALSVLSFNPAAVLLGAALLGGTFMGITALGFVYARELSRGDPRRNLALMTAAFGLGQAVGPTFAGVTYDFAGSFLLPSLAASAALLLAASLAVNPPARWGSSAGRR